MLGAARQTVQRAAIDREPEAPDEQRLKFRISINLSDVITT